MQPFIGTPLSYGQVDAEISTIIEKSRNHRTCHVPTKPIGVLHCTEKVITDLYDINSCKKDYIIGIMRVYVFDSNCGAHANALWFDLKNRRIYRFDPLFSKYKAYTQHALDVLAMTFRHFDIVDVSTMATTLGPQAKYNKATMISYLKKCNVDNNLINYIQRGIDSQKLKAGMCMSWSLLFLRKLVKNDFDVKNTVLQLIVENGENDNLIRKYSVNVAIAHRNRASDCYAETKEACFQFVQLQDYHLYVNSFLREYRCEPL